MAVGLVAAGDARAGVIVGPGDTVTDFNDSAFGIFAVDLTNPAVVGAGSYTATTFSYQFLTKSGTLNGTVTPVLVNSIGIILAVGDSVTYLGDTPFVSVAFGGSSGFTLGGIDLVYAAIYWDGGAPGTTMPVGFLDGVGNTFVYFGGPPTAPVVGAQVGVGADDADLFPRTYDFSIEFGPAAVPEPASLALLGLGAAGLAARRIRRQAM